MCPWSQRARHRLLRCNTSSQTAGKKNPFHPCAWQVSNPSRLNLQPIDEEALGKTAEHLQANNHEYLLVNLESEGPVNGQPDKQRILAAITCEANRCWFIKMTGETAAVESQQAAFKDFLQSLKLP